ncbi:MAG: hypothetical protein C0402_09775 [Thermodesulfovibrio sp.]|nr:hypothetical protein [Thermodesulfovibrio sp.]
MKNLTQRLAPVKGLSLVLSPLLLLIFFAVVQSLYRESFRNCAVSLFLPEKEPDSLPKVKAEAAPAGNSVLTPISLVDEAFKGYAHERSAASPHKEKKVEEAPAFGPQREAGPDRNSPALSIPEGPETGIRTPAPKVPHGETDRAKTSAEVSGAEPARAPPVVSSTGPSEKPADMKARYQQFVSERAAAAGLSEARQEEMVRSFEELSGMMPAEDAWKIVRMRIRNQASR